jgi:ATP-binding cassette subfamily B protein
VKANAKIYLIAILFIVAANIVQAYFPKILGEFTDELEAGHLTKESVRNYSLLLLAIGLGFGVLFGIGQFTVAKLGRKFEFSTRQKLFRHFTTLSEHYFSKSGIGKLLSYVMNDVTSVRESISNGVNQTTNATILLISSVVMMTFSNIPAHMIAFSVVPLLSIPFLVVYFGPRIRLRSRTVQESLAMMTESAEEQFGGIRVTKTFAVEPVAEERFGRTVDQIRDNQLRLVRMSSLFQALIPFAGAMSFVVSILYGGYLTIQGTMTLGSFVSLTLYLRMIMNPLQQIGNVINMMQRSRASLERLNALLAVKPDIQEHPEAIPLGPGPAGIVIRNLTFRYPGSDHASLEDINLEVQPGKTLGIIGRTGSGKTTLVKLLLRVYDPPEKTIFINGIDVRRLTLESLRTRTAYVPQDGFLFSTSIRDNISFSDRSAELGQVEAAAKEAQIYNNIMEFPKKFDTVLGERGITLSGGQRQRTSLSRGFLKDSSILILDDSVSAVDAVTETKIIHSIRSKQHNQTTLIIAHRISAVKHADEIVVLDEGKIVQRGKHEQLIAEDGLYATLYAIQQEGRRSV